MTPPSTRADGRRPTSAKARNCGRWRSDGAAGKGDVMLGSRSSLIGALTSPDDRSFTEAHVGLVSTPGRQIEPPRNKSLFSSVSGGVHTRFLRLPNEGVYGRHTTFEIHSVRKTILIARIFPLVIFDWIC